MWKEKLELYDKLVAKCPRFERKGKMGPYTSANATLVFDVELVDVK